MKNRDRPKGRRLLFDGTADPGACCETIAELYAERLPRAYSYSPLRDIQVLCPSKKGEAGTVNLNKILQSLVNPPSDNKNELNSGFRLFREGDKVMQIKTITISIGTAIRSPAREFLTETSE